MMAQKTSLVLASIDLLVQEFLQVDVHCKNHFLVLGKVKSLGCIIG
jgi:hypothetical protein